MVVVWCILFTLGLSLLVCCVTFEWLLLGFLIWGFECSNCLLFFDAGALWCLLVDAFCFDVRVSVLLCYLVFWMGLFACVGCFG